MFLQELTGVKRFHKYTQYQLYTILRRMGIHVVNGGSYGTILTSDKWDYVVKLFSDDPYYLSFVKFVMANPNPHYPKIGKAPFQMHTFHSRYEGEADKMWLMKIEKLQPLDKHTATYIIRNLSFAGTVSYWLETENSRPESKERLDYNNPHAGERVYFDGTKHKGTVREWAMAHEWLISLARAYYAIFESEEVEGAEDFHAGNFMKRADGTIVIIDPLWEGSSPYKEYDNWYRSMTDGAYSREEDIPQRIQGPRYAKHKQQAKQKKPVSSNQDVEYDIPF